MSKDDDMPTGLVLPPLSSVSKEERLKLKVPDGLMPELQKACQSVLQVGWDKMQWPRNFSALHLAARIGSEAGVRLLLQANAHPGLSLKDNIGMRPIDIARKQGASEQFLEVLNPVKYRFIELRVHAEGVDRNIKFRYAPVDQQVEEVCTALQMRYDDKENYRMLILSSHQEVRVLRGIDQLMSLREGTKVLLEKVDSLVKHSLEKLRRVMHSTDYPSEDVPAALRRLSSVLQSDERCVKEFIDQRGMRVVLEACIGSRWSTDPAMACLCLVLQFPMCMEWLRRRASEFIQPLFRRIFAELFPDVEEFTEQTTVSPYATLSVSLFLLLELGEPAVDAFHKAGMGQDGEDMAPFYPAIMKSILDENAPYFQATAAHGIICTALNVASGFSNLAMYEEMWNEIVRLAGSETPVERLKRKADREALFQKEVVMISMSTSAESFGGDQAAELHWLRKTLAHTYEQLTQEREKDKRDIETLQSELRSRQQALKTMVSFVKIDSAPLVEQVLETIVHHGWDEMQWQNGYTLLHHVCECSDDPSVVDLVACFATEFDTYSADTHMRPIDYARQNPVPGIAKVLEKHRKTRDKATGRRKKGADDEAGQPESAAPKLRHMDTAPQLHRNSSTRPSQSTGPGSAKEPFQPPAGIDETKEQTPEQTRALGSTAQAPSASRQEEGAAAAARASVAPPSRISGTASAGAAPPAQARASAVAGDETGAVPPEKVTPALQQVIAAFKGAAARKARQNAHKLGIDAGLMSTSLDLERARAWANDHKNEDVEVLGLNELRRLLLNSEAEREKLQKQVAAQQAAGATGPGKGLGGPLDERQLIEYFPQYKTYGSVLLHEKLQRPVLAGGLALGRADATAALGQLEAIGRLFRRIDATAGSGGTAAEEAKAEDGHAAASEKGKAAKGPGKGKKGAPPPPPGAAAAAGAEEAAAPEATAGKGKKGAAPAPPKGKAAGKGATDTAPAGDDAAAPAGKGKGPGAPPGKGGPPGKGPGKGPGGPAAPAGGGKGKPGGKGKAGAVQFTKPAVKPTVAMKSLQWNRLVFGEKLTKGTTIWDKVTDIYDDSIIPLDDLHARFSKAAGIQKVDKREAEKAKKIKEYTVIPNEKRLPYEVMATSLPPTQRIAKAIQNMDDDFMSAQWIKDLQPFCPDAQQMEQLIALQTKMEETPDVPLAKVEQYMWALGQVSACRMRLRCWDYIRSIADQLDLFREQLQAFENMLDGFSNHDAIATCLAVILAFGNYLNGGNTRLGQADGFALDALTSLEGVRDPRGKDIRQLVFQTLFDRFPGKAEEMLQDLSSGLQGLLQRQIVKSEDSGGDESLQRSIRICIEDLETQIDKFKNEYEKMLKEFKDGQSFINDPADLYKMRMPAQFQEVNQQLCQLAEDVNDAKKRFDQLLAWFHAKDTLQKRLADREQEAKDKEATSSGKKGPKAKQISISSDWCCIWDDFLVPKSLIDRRDEKTKKTVLVPRFCRGRPIDIESMQLLFELVDPEEEKKKKAAQEQQKSGRRAMRLKA